MTPHRTRLLLAATVLAFGATGCAKPAENVEPPIATSTAGGTATAAAATTSAGSGGGPVENMPASWKLCQNQLRGSSMGYPGEWFTTSLTPNDACSLFHETSFTIPVAGEYPLVAMSAAQVDVPLATYVAQLTAPASYTVLLKENTTVAGKTAVRFEISSLQQGLYDVGTREYGFAIERGSRTFVLSTTAVPGETRYESWKFVIDTARGTLTFL